MAGLNWTYDQLSQYMLEASNRTDLNPLIKKLLTVCPDSSVFNIGGYSVVLWICPNVVAKVALDPGDQHLRHEQEVLKSLDRCPHIVQHFFHGTDVSFLELIGNGTLHDRMSMVDKPRLTLQWMLQLSSAASSLEAHGYAHGDINPQNILLDAQDQLKLIDFDHSLKVGDDLDVGYEPYVRQRRENSGGVYGVAGPVTEQFALGSVFWYMMRGSELYAELEGHEKVLRLLDGVFPLEDPKGPIDNIIAKCWNGYYRRIADIEEDIKAVGAVDLNQESTRMSGDEKQGRRLLCEKYYTMAGTEEA
ncbi:putative Rho-associated protein kinase [Hypoxylon sp. NC1633]|nr:putative Rho-associated protein kinase [Hypoxylon sp. NC1633]